MSKLNGSAQYHARIIAAYLLDRADQYPTDSPLWQPLVDAVDGILSGDAHGAWQRGEFDKELLVRVDKIEEVRMSRKKRPKLCVNGCNLPVQPPSKVLCKKCFAELDRKMQALGTPR